MLRCLYQNSKLQTFIVCLLNANTVNWQFRDTEYVLLEGRDRDLICFIAPALLVVCVKQYILIKYLITLKGSIFSMLIVSQATYQRKDKQLYFITFFVFAGDPKELCLLRPPLVEEISTQGLSKCLMAVIEEISLVWQDQSRPHESNES